MAYLEFASTGDLAFGRLPGDIGEVLCDVGEATEWLANEENEL